MNNGRYLISDGIYSISVLNENEIVISGGFNDRKVLKTVNGGVTWTTLSNNSFSKMQFLTENIGYAHNYYDKKVYKTIDGGAKWTVMFIAPEDIQSIDFIDQDNGYLVGSNGLIFKTNNGGTDWIKLTIPYEYYTYVKFYSKNVGYIFDEDGKMYKTEDGGGSWNNIFYLPSNYKTNSISIVGKDIYLAGEYGRILKSEIDFKSYNLQLNPAENILSRSVVLSGNVSVNNDYFDKVYLEYFNSSVINKIDISTSVMKADTSLHFTLPIADLDPDSTYFYRIVATRDNVSYYSDMESFATKEDYLFTINSNYVLAKKAEMSGSITSYKYDINDVEFQYSTEENFSKYSILSNSIVVKGNTTENVNGILADLKPKTRYYVRLKAKYEGKEVYSEIISFVTQSEYEINLYYPSIVDNDVSLSAYISSKSNTISNIVFEYGILNYDNSIAINEQVLVGSAKFVRVQLTNLDPDKIYFYRIKALNGSDVIYSMSAIFNTSKQPLFKVGNVFENDDSIKLTGYLNTTGGYITNIGFEYGLTPDFGSTISTNFSDSYGNGTFALNAVLNNPLKGVTYYYRLKGLDQNNNPLYSDISSFTTKSLGINSPDFNKSISLYPNPTNGLINLIIPENKNVNSILISDELGKVINYVDSVKTGDPKNIDLSGKATGVYYIKIIMDDNSIINKKVILK